MELKLFIKSYLRKSAKLQLARLSIRSERADDQFSISLEQGEIGQDQDGAFHLKACLSGEHAEVIEKSHERVLSANSKRIDQKDALYVDANISSGETVSARVFWAEVTTKHAASGTTWELSAKVHELELKKSRAKLPLQHNTFIIHALQSRCAPCDIRAEAPEHLADLLVGNWAGKNSHVLRDKEDVCSFRDNLHQVIAINTLSRQEAEDARINVNACLSFLLGQANEAVGVLYAEDESEIFTPAQPAKHGISYSQPIYSPSPYYEPACAAFWPAFAKILSRLKTLNAKQAQDLRRAINKPLQLPEESSLELRLMLLSIAIETLSMAVLPDDLSKYSPPQGLEVILQNVRSSQAPKPTIERAQNLLGNMQKAAATNVLKEFGIRMKIPGSTVGKWGSIRGRVVHGNGLDYDNIDELMRDYDIVLMLHNAIVLSCAGYTGPIANHQKIGASQNLLLSSEGVTEPRINPLKELEVTYYEKLPNGQFTPKAV